MLYLFIQLAIISLPLYILAWVFLGIGLASFIALFLYTKYGRELSVKFSVITVIIGSIFLGFSIHFFLLNFGI